MKRLVALVLITSLSGSLTAAVTYRVCNLSNENISVETKYSKVLPMIKPWSEAFSIKAGGYHDITWGELAMLRLRKITELEQIKVGNTIVNYNPSMLKKSVVGNKTLLEDNTIGLYQIGDRWSAVITKGTDCSKAKAKMLELK